MIRKCIALVLIVLILNIPMGCFSYHEIKIEDEETINLAGKVKITLSYFDYLNCNHYNPKSESLNSNKLDNWTSSKGVQDKYKIHLVIGNENC